MSTMDSMSFNQIKDKDAAYCLQNYSRFPVLFTKGAGSYLYDDAGREYLDFASGIGVNSIGHSHPHWVEAVTRQAEKLAHVSNLFYTEEYVVLAERLTKAAGMSRAFFCNSGAEANEAAIKTARKYSRDKYGDGRSTIITLEKSFHGRTLATVRATGQPDYHLDFAPYPEGFKYIRANDNEALRDAAGSDVCAIMVEGVLGEGGIIPLEQGFVDEIFKIAGERDILVIFDEVQTGIGRTGHLFSYMGFSVKPDLVTAAKGLGGGLPVGALLTGDKCGGVLGPGTHGSTFGGNSIVCAGANAVLDIILGEGFLDSVQEKGNFLMEELKKVNNPVFYEFRGKGLMIGVEINGVDVKELVTGLLGRGLVTLSAGGNTLRLLPPLTISYEELKKGLAKL